MMLRTGVLAAALLAAMVTGCADEGTTPTEPFMAGDDAPLLAGAPAEDVSHRFLRCPVSTTRSASRTIGLLGGTIRVDGHGITIPPGAVVLPTKFTVTVPASEYVQVEIHAEGRESFTFLLPATVTMSYDRCQGTDPDPDQLGVWYISGLTGFLLEFMGGTADPEARNITFTTGHLSGFIIAN